jgi:predicted small integral membrane protein
LGGTITSFHVNLDAGGWCGYSIRPGFFNTLIVAAAGYTGSFLAGGLLFVLAAWSRRDRWYLGILGGVLLYLSWLCLTSASLFGTVFCAATGIVYLVLAKLPLGGAHDFLLRLTGISIALISLSDIKDDLVDRTVAGSDGYVISQTLHLPAHFIGLVWLGVGVIMMGVLLFLSVKVEAKDAAKAS